MNTLNKVMMIGNLTADPEIRNTKSGKSVARTRLALHRRTAGGEGERKEETTFIDVVLWDRQAELAERFLKKGRSVLIEGRLQQESWQDKQSGQNRSKISVVGERIEFMNDQRHEEGAARGEPAYA